jgi:hypothetical protein
MIFWHIPSLESNPSPSRHGLTFYFLRSSTDPLLDYSQKNVSYVYFIFQYGYIKKEYGHVNGKLDKVALTINNMPKDDATFCFQASNLLTNFESIKASTFLVS